MINRMMSIVLVLFLAAMASIIISIPFNYRITGEVLIAIVVVLTVTGLALRISRRPRRPRPPGNPWGRPGVTDARSAFLEAERMGLLKKGGG